MPRRKSLSSDEKARIETFAACGKSCRDIGRKIGRSHQVVASYLNNPAQYNKRKKRGVVNKLSPADSRRICRLASNSTLSCRQIAEEMQLPVTPRRISQIIHSQPHLKSAKMQLAPLLKDTHVEARLQFARENMSRDWKLVVNFCKTS